MFYYDVSYISIKDFKKGLKPYHKYFYDLEQAQEFQKRNYVDNIVIVTMKEEKYGEIKRYT